MRDDSLEYVNQTWRFVPQDCATRHAAILLASGDERAHRELDAQRQLAAVAPSPKATRACDEPPRSGDAPNRKKARAAMHAHSSFYA